MKFLFSKMTLFRVRLLSIFFLIGSASLAQNPNQKISLHIQNISVKELIKQIESLTTYTVVYRDVLLNDKKDITINEDNKPLVDILKSSLSSKGLQVVFNNNTIVITTKNEEPQITKKTKIVSGVVLDEKGLPVIGASVLIPGTSIGVATDINGRFTLEAPTNSKLRISYIGYEAKEELLKVSSDMKITLEQTPHMLTEMVITAQAIGQKNAIRQQINSNTIKNVVAADRLQENPDANAVEAIGRLPGISVSRNGGEGTGLVIRGLQSQYTAVTLNGVALPSGSGGGRDVNISGFSQYALQGVEVYKSLTADMEANGVAGTVNLKLREAPKGLHANFLAQLGYNNMNSYFGNYKVSGEFSNRFLDNKLGVFFVATAEQVNRSTQTMSANYRDLSSLNNDLGLISINLNNISATKTRRSAMLSLDYKLAPSTTLNLYGLYNYSKNDNQSQSKGYNMMTPNATIGMNYNPDNNQNVYQIALSGLTKLNKSKIELDYGIAFSNSSSNNQMSRGWSGSYYPLPSSLASQITLENSKLSPDEAIKAYTSLSLPDANTRLDNMSQSSTIMNDRNFTSYFNVKIPYSFGDKITAYLKFGGTYRNKARYQDVQAGTIGLNTSLFATQILKDSLSWLKSTNQLLTLEGMNDKNVNSFLDGKYNYGSFYDFSKLNQITDVWNRASDYWYPKGQDVWGPMFGGPGKIGWNQNISSSIMNDQDITEQYAAGYLMTEMNFGQYLMFLPGLRFEETYSTMKGFTALEPTRPDPLYMPLPGTATSATRTDKFLLPMVHLRIKPCKWNYIHLAYTQTLSRPNFNQISPTEYRNTGLAPFTYTARNPALLTEHWTNYDVQFTIHDNKLGLFSVSGFYKTVQNYIGSLSYTRIKGDPIIEPFSNTDQVNVSLIQNFQYPIYLKGVEVELQTSFWYLPAPFKYLTFTINGTYTDSRTEYRNSYIVNKVPVGGGRPVPTRIDTTRSGVMLNQPKYILNTSLGYNRKGLNIWLSYQYIGNIQTGIGSFSTDILDGMKEPFSRLDLQISQRLSGKLSGLEFLLNMANLTNSSEVQHLRYDSRSTYIESYGWTADFGVRYRF